MFILRTITDSSEQNFNLGEFYTITYKLTSPNTWKELIAEFDPINLDSCYAIIIGEHGDKHFISSDYHHYIMTEGGKTFSKL